VFQLPYRKTYKQLTSYSKDLLEKVVVTVVVQLEALILLVVYTYGDTVRSGSCIPNSSDQPLAHILSLEEKLEWENRLLLEEEEEFPGVLQFLIAA
jgi:hypothetical protein